MKWLLKVIEVKTSNGQNNYCPWWTDEIIGPIQSKKQAYQKQLMINDTEDRK